jgi:hypothetical protein
MRKPDGNLNATGAWKRIFGLEWFKIDYTLKRWLYRLFGLTMPKLKDQSEYWMRRGLVYREEILNSGYLEREVFFQNLIMDRIGRCIGGGGGGGGWAWGLGGGRGGKSDDVRGGSSDIGC